MGGVGWLGRFILIIILVSAQVGLKLGNDEAIDDFSVIVAV